MPPGERRGGEKEAGRAEGGRREERGAREEGARGRGEGKWAAWEGEAAGAGLRPGPERGRPGGVRGRRSAGVRGVEAAPRVRAFSRSAPLSSHPTSPSLAARPGPRAPDAASQLPGWRGRGSNCKTFRKLRGVAGRGLRGPAGPGRGRAADPGGHARTADAPSIPPLTPTTLADEHPLPSCPGPPLPRSGGEGAEPRARPPGGRLGEGRRGPCAMCRATTFARLPLAFA